jgi:hypothetical protein
MEYYILQAAAGTTETGNEYPQVIYIDAKKLNPNPFFIVNTVDPWEYVPETILPFEPLTLVFGAKLTDLMSSPFRVNGFLISPKLRELFEQEGVTDCRYYPVKVMYNKKGDTKDYYYYHSVSCLRDYVDYKRSKFFINKRGIGFSHYIANVNTYNDLKQIQSTLDLNTSIKPEQFYLKANFPYHQPLFRICVFNNGFFITGKFKSEIEKNKIAGVHTIPAKDLIKTPNLS